MTDGKISKLENEEGDLTEVIQIGSQDSYSKVLRSAFGGSVLLILKDWKELYYLDLKDQEESTPQLLLTEETDIEQLKIYGSNQNKLVIMITGKLKFFNLDLKENGNIEAEESGEIPFGGFNSQNIAICPNNEFLAFDSTGDRKGIDIYRINREEKIIYTSIELKSVGKRNIDNIYFTEYLGKNKIGILCVVGIYPENTSKFIFIVYDTSKKTVMKIVEEDVDCGEIRTMERYGNTFFGVDEYGKMVKVVYE